MIQSKGDQMKRKYQQKIDKNKSIALGAKTKTRKKKASFATKPNKRSNSTSSQFSDSAGFSEYADDSEEEKYDIELHETKCSKNI